MRGAAGVRGFVTSLVTTRIGFETTTKSVVCPGVGFAGSLVTCGVVTSVLEMRAWFATSAPSGALAASFTSTVNVCATPGASDGRVHVRFPPLCSAPGATTVEASSCGGSASATSTLVPAVAPTFAMRSV